MSPNSAWDVRKEPTLVNSGLLLRASTPLHQVSSTVGVGNTAAAPGAFHNAFIEKYGSALLPWCASAKRALLLKAVV